LDLLVRLQKQIWRFQNAFTDRRCCIAPSGVELAGLAAAEVMASQHVRHAPAVVEIGARHRRQILHGDMGRYLAAADLLLDGFGKLFHQSQSPGHPTHAAVEAARQIIEAIAETLLQLLKQPPFFKRRRPLA
jgi:hypothetical protein